MDAELARRAGRSPHLHYVAALDGLRAVAVLAVIAHHDRYGWAKGGFLGVDTFFALSGFLITTLLLLEYRRDTGIALGGFWARRARRLLPALFLVLVFVAAYTHLAVAPWERIGVRNDMYASLFYVANWRFVLDKQAYFQVFSAASPLRHMWSLSIEEQYYLFWPLIVLGCMRITKGGVRLLAAICALGTVASIAAMWLLYTPGDPTRAYYGTDARVQTLLLGALLGIVLVRYVPDARRGRVIAWAAVPALLLMFVAFATASGTSRLYYTGGATVFALLSVTVIAGSMHPGPVARVLSFGPLPWIGRISYGLYLWHWPVNIWLTPSRVGLGFNALNLLRLGVTFALAVTSYYLVERPIRERRAPAWRTAAWFAPAAAVVIVVIALSARGAGPPPSYAWGLGDPLFCGEPRAAETAEAVQANADAGPLDVPADARAERVLLLGDSTACSLWPGLAAVGAAEGIVVDQGSVFGCGVASDEITTTRNEAITPNSQRCHDMVEQALRPALARTRPTVVLWMSTWEKSDLVVDGETVVAGTPEGEAEIMARMDDALARVTAGGAKVVLVTEASQAPNPARDVATYDPVADDAGYGRLNDLLRRFHARHPDTTEIVDLAAKVCPGDPPCPAEVEGMTARPDGRHFTPAASVWAARWILTESLQGGS